MSGDVDFHRTVALYLCKVAHTAQKQVGDTRRSPAAARYFVGGVFVYIHIEQSCRTAYDFLKRGSIVITQPRVDAETGTQGRGEQARTGGGADKCKGIQTNLHAAGVGTAVDHDVDLKVLHGRIQIFFHHGREPVYFVDKQHIVGFEVGQKPRQFARFIQHRAGSGLDAYAQFVGDDIRKRGLPQTRRSVQQHMVQGLLALAGGHHKHLEVARHALLALKTVETGRAQGFLQLFVGACEVVLLGMKNIVHGKAKIRISWHCRDGVSSA